MTKSSVIKLAAPFERLKSFNYSPDVTLRLAVIMQAIIDSTNTSPKKEARKAELASKKWIFEENEDFTATCLEAGIEPCEVRKVTKNLIELQRNKSNTKYTVPKYIIENLFFNKGLKLS